jgi:hypothetical protein
MLLTIIVICSILAGMGMEGFAARKGLCDCCGCRMVDCDKCMKNAVTCCGGTFNYTRYTF